MIETVKIPLTRKEREEEQTRLNNLPYN